MKRFETIEIDVEAEYEIEPEERGYFDAAKGEGLPPSGGYATLQGMELHLWVHCCTHPDCDGASERRITTADRTAKPRCLRHPAATMESRHYTIDLPLDLLSQGTIEGMEEGAYEEASEAPDEPDDRYEPDPRD